MFGFQQLGHCVAVKHHLIVEERFHFETSREIVDRGVWTVQGLERTHVEAVTLDQK